MLCYKKLWRSLKKESLGAEVIFRERDLGGRSHITVFGAPPDLTANMFACRHFLEWLEGESLTILMVPLATEVGPTNHKIISAQTRAESLGCDLLLAWPISQLHEADWLTWISQLDKDTIEPGPLADYLGSGPSHHHRRIPGMAND